MENKIKSRIKELTTETLKEMAAQLMDNFEDGAGVVFMYVTNELEERMPEADFVQFCDNL